MSPRATVEPTKQQDGFLAVQMLYSDSVSRSQPGAFFTVVADYPLQTSSGLRGGLQEQDAVVVFFPWGLLVLEICMV